MKVQWRNPDHLWLAVALCVGALVRFWHITRQSPFLDEAFSLKVGAESIPQLLHDTAYQDVQPPLFYLFAHFAIGVLHWPAWDYRLLSAPFALITIAATFAVGRKFMDAPCAAFAALIVALVPALVMWDRLFRMYSIWTAATAVTWLLLAGATETRAKLATWRWGTYVVLAATLPYLHYLGVVTLVSQAAFAAAKPAARWPVFVSCAAAGAAMVPWLWALRVQFPLGATAEPAPDWWSPAVELFALGAPVAWASATAFVYGVAALLIASIVFGAVMLRRSIVIFWLGGIALQVIGGIVFHKNLLVVRYLFPLVPAMALAIGAAMQACLRSRFRVAAVAYGACLTTLLAVSTQNIVLDPYYQLTDWFSVNYTVKSHENAGDAFVFVQAYPIAVVGSYAAFLGHKLAGPNVPADIPPTIAWLDRASNRRVWYIENQPWYADPDGRVRTSLAQQRPLLGRWIEPKAYDANAVSIELYGPKK